MHSVADHPISEKLFVCKVEVASGQFRQVGATPGIKRDVHLTALNFGIDSFVRNLVFVPS